MRGVAGIRQGGAVERRLNRDPADDLGAHELGRREKRFEGVEASLAVRDDDGLLLRFAEELQDGAGVVRDALRSVEVGAFERGVAVRNALRLEGAHLRVEGGEAAGRDVDFNSRKRLGDLVTDGKEDAPFARELEVHVE